MNIGAVIKELRRNKGIKQEELADILQVSVQTEYFTSRDPERNAVPLHWFFFANHRFAFGIH